MDNTLNMILDKRIVAVIRDVSSGQILPTAEALIGGGIVCLEVTFDSGSKERSEDTLQSIALLKKEFGGDIALGAGTVLTVENVREAAQAGAAYIVSPGADEAVIGETKKQGLIAVPGALTPTEILTAWGWGADIVKLFPASVQGTEYVKAIRGPIRHIPLFAVGGVEAGNAKGFLEAGCAGICAGSNLVNTRWIAAGDYGAIRKLAQEYVHACA